MGQFKLCEKKEKILQIPLDFFREFGIIMAVTRNESFLVGQKAVLCNGSTADSDSVCLGSNPGTAAKDGAWTRSGPGSLFYEKATAKAAAYLRGVAQFGRALRSGRRGRRFKSCHLDHVYTS